jgi:hypothetical protein
MDPTNHSCQDTEIVKALSTVIEQIIRWGGSQRSLEVGEVATPSPGQSTTYCVELIDVRTRSLINERCHLESHLPIPIPDVGEIVGGPETEPHRVVKRTFKYRIKQAGLECHVVLYCVNLKEEDDAKLFRS